MALSAIHRQLGMTLGAEEGGEEYRKDPGYADEALESALSMKEQEWEGLALHHKGLALARWNAVNPSDSRRSLRPAPCNRKRSKCLRRPHRADTRGKALCGSGNSLQRA